MLQRFMNLLRPLFSYTYSGKTVHGELSSSLEKTTGIHQGCAILPFLFHHIINEITEDAYGCRQDVDIELPKRQIYVT